MNRALGAVALAASLFVAACDDGALRVFEPRELALVGGGGQGSAGAEAGGAASGTAASEAGTAASEAGTSTVGPTAPLLIDDFEDGDPRAKEPLGWWYPVNDKTSLQGFAVEPASNGAASTYALRTHGSGFQSWGAAVGVDLVGDATPLDLSSYKELCFLARVEAGSSTSIQVHLLRGDLHYTQDLSVSEAWGRHCLSLVGFKSTNDQVLMPDQLIALQFFFAPSSPFEFWLDDVEVTP